jgi:hypothetical protein
MGIETASGSVKSMQKLIDALWWATFTRARLLSIP